MAEFDDPSAIAERAAKVAKVAKQTITDAAAAANDAFAKINPAGGGASGFTAGDAIQSLSTLVRIATTGAIGMARIPLQTRGENRPLLLVDHLATVAARTVADIDLVAQETAAQIDADSFKQDQWVDAAVKLTGIVMVRGAEIIETVGAGPGRYRSPWMHSDDQSVHLDEAEASFSHQLTVVSLGRPGVVDENIAAQVVLEPNGGLLPAGNADRKFTLRVNSAGLPSGLYQGTVRVRREGDPTDRTGLDMTVPVTIVL